jgi:hypothetical protein
LKEEPAGRIRSKDFLFTKMEFQHKFDIEKPTPSEEGMSFSLFAKKKRAIVE